MPSKSYLMNTLAIEPYDSHFVAILEDAKSNHSVTEIVYLKYKADGSKEVKLRNSSEEEFTGTGASKMEAIADCVSTKYPS